MPKSFQDKYPNQMRNLRLNSRKLTTPFDIHETLKHFLDFNTQSSGQQKSDHKIPRGISLFKYINPSRSCEDAQVEAHWCSCLNWINLNITFSPSSPQQSSDFAMIDKDYIDETSQEIFSNNKSNNSNLNLVGKKETLLSGNNSIDLVQLNKNPIDYNEYKSIRQNLVIYKQSVLEIAQKAVNYMNSLIDYDFKRFCERIRLHSIQKLAKLELNRKLLLFKKSKDIHGRVALFDNSSLDTSFDLDYFILESNNKSASNVSFFSSFMNLETIFQIVLTTWPGNASYELSFKYNLQERLFTFNKNEISRINSYNGTSSCMLKKRPDLRQYCYCKYK
jgi:hypothetical protein